MRALERTVLSTMRGWLCSISLFWLAHIKPHRYKALSNVALKFRPYLTFSSLFFVFILTHSCSQIHFVFSYNPAFLFSDYGLFTKWLRPLVPLKLWYLNSHICIGLPEEARWTFNICLTTKSTGERDRVDRRVVCTQPLFCFPEIINFSKRDLPGWDSFTCRWHCSSEASIVLTLSFHQAI